MKPLKKVVLLWGPLLSSQGLMLTLHTWKCFNFSDIATFGLNVHCSVERECVYLEIKPLTFYAADSDSIPGMAWDS